MDEYENHPRKKPSALRQNGSYWPLQPGAIPYWTPRAKLTTGAVAAASGRGAYRYG